MEFFFTLVNGWKSLTTLRFFISNQFIGKLLLDGKLLSNFQGLNLFYEAAIKTTDTEKWSFSFAINAK